MMKAHSGGFTLVEMIITITLAGIIAIGVIQVSGKMASRSANPMLRYQAISVAEAYLNEILAKDFAVMGDAKCTTTGISRTNYGYICNFHGLNDVGAKDQTDTAIPELSAYAVSVTVVQSASLGDISTATETQLITVAVDGPEDLDASLSAYRSNF